MICAQRRGASALAEDSQVVIYLLSTAVSRHQFREIQLVVDDFVWVLEVVETYLHILEDESEQQDTEDCE